MTLKERDAGYMRRALALARRGLGRTSPNPLVGAVVVKGNRVVGSGWHRRAGAPHAEVEAIGRAGHKARGGELYVNLEPCGHYGRTPPCTDAIIGAGIRRVVVGMVDPNPLVNGKGIRALRRGGVEVTVGVLEDSCQTLNRHFATYIKNVGRMSFTKLPSAWTDGLLRGVESRAGLLGPRRGVRLIGCEA